MDYSNWLAASGTGNSGTVTIGANPDRLIIVSVSTYKNGSTSRHVSSMNLGGSPLTKLTEINSPDDKMRTEIWYYLNPPSGPNNLAMSWPINTDRVLGYMFFSGVDQATPFADIQSFSANSGDPSLTLASECGGIVHDVIARKNNGSFTPGPGQTELWDFGWTSNLTGTGNNEDGSPSVPMTHTSDDNGKAFAHCAISIKPSTIQVEICGNGLDDDCDDLVDCDDPDCGTVITGEKMGKVASNVYSQEDFTSSVFNALDSTFASPSDVAIDPTTGKFFISDPTANRILRYADAATFFTGGKAEGVLGQPDFLTTGFLTSPTITSLRNPQGISIDENGSLFVADYYNRRVIRYDNASSKANGAPADGVLGQPDFTSNSIGLSQDRIDYCADVIINSSGSLVVSDKSNRRVLIFYNASSLANGAPADIVLGKPDFVSNSPTTCTQANINSAWELELVGNSLYVSDYTCHRVMVWDDVFSKSNGAAADRVLGQLNFTSSSIALNQRAIVHGSGIEHDGNGNLYISDSYHDRVLFFEDANSLANGANATEVIGQSDFVTSGAGTSATQISNPRGMEMIEYNGQSYLMLLDNSNYRALFFAQSVSTDELTAVSGTLHGSDPAGTGSLTFTVVTQPVLGSVSIDNASTGAFTYTPTGACMLDQDSVLTFKYRVTNGNLCSRETILEIHVSDVAPCAEICGNAIDDDGDGLIDCADFDCNFSLDCSDNDSDGYNDAVDLDDDNDGILDADEQVVVQTSYQPPCNPFTMDFTGPPTLVGGVDLLEGAIYKYTSVSAGVDAKVTIIKNINQTAPSIDNDATDPTYFKPQSAFVLNGIGDRSYTEYLFEFVTGVGETPVIIPELFINFNDIDGNTGSGEQNWVQLPTSYSVDVPTDLNTVLGNWILGSSNTTEYVGASNINPQVNFSARYINRSSLKIRVGVENRTAGTTSSTRAHSIEFACVSNFLDPTTYLIDLDEDGHPNSTDLDSDNDGIYDCEESLSGQPASGGILTGGVDVYGIPLSVSNGSGGVNYIYGDADVDAVLNAYSSDSDGDGCPDVTEAGFPDSDGDGQLGGLVPPTVDSSGIVTSGGL